MAKTITATTSYTSNIVVNGTTVSADKIYVNDTQVRRCIVNGTDVIHKFTRTIVTASSNLTFNFTVRFTAESSPYQYSNYFTSPIYADVTVTDNRNSGFTSISCIAPILRFYCEKGNQGNSGSHYYQQQLTNQSLPIGQTTTLTFSDFNNKYIHPTSGSYQATHYELSFHIKDPDDITSYAAINSEDNISDSALTNYSRTKTLPRVINKTLSDNTVQEY